MTSPYSLVVIKSLAIGRGWGMNILSDILDTCPVTLKKIRSWVVCDNTWKALGAPVSGVESDCIYQVENVQSLRNSPSYICLFIHEDKVTDPTDLLFDKLGPNDINLCLPHHVKYKYKPRNMSHPCDTVLRISHPKRVDYEAMLLFDHFDKDNLFREE